jgi:hypothetical protein
MDPISGSLTISYDPKKDIYTLRFMPGLSEDPEQSAHKACQPDGRSCGRIRAKFLDAVQFLQKASEQDAIALLAKTRVDGGTSVKVNITRYQHGTLIHT